MRFLSLLALLAAAWLPAQAQQVGRVEGRQVTPGGYYVNAQPGEPTTRVAIWGSVPRAGVYELGRGFDAEALVALAGGPLALNAGERDLDLVIRMRRGERVLFDMPFQRFAASPAGATDLQDGDVVEIDIDRSTRVSVWGTVARPGLYAVPADATVREALSEAGGPDLPALRNREKQEVTFRHVRGATGEVIYDGPLADLPPSTEAIQDGDILEVNVRTLQRWTTRDTLTAFGVAASTVVAATQVYRVLNTN